MSSHEISFISGSAEIAQSAAEENRKIDRDVRMEDKYLLK